MRKYYDGATSLTALPSGGNLTRVDELSDWPAGGPVYTTTQSYAYDANGRVVDSTDALGRDTATTYTPATGGPLTGTTVTDPMGFATTTTLDPSWGLPTKVVDPNGRQTDETYDGLGRLTAVWLPDRSKAGGDSADQTYAYTVSKTAPAVVSTSRLRNDGSYLTTYRLYDGDLRERESIEPAEGDAGGQLITDTLYDSRGLAVQQDGPYYSAAAYPSAPPSAVTQASSNAIPSQTVTTYDGAGRATVAAFRVNGVERWRTTTAYGGDRTSVTPPAGKGATTTVVDARGRKTALLQYHGGTPSGGYDETDYSYTPGGRLATVAGPLDQTGTSTARPTWSYTYDLLGRETSQNDPDRGLTTTTYDADGETQSVTDARGTTLWYDYDADGRKIRERLGGSAGAVLASWTYDTLLKGELTSSTRTADGADYTQAVTGYDSMARPTGTSLTIPAAEGALAGTYTTATTYNLDGTVRTEKQAAAPGLPAETLTWGYDSLGQPENEGGWGSIVAGVTYDSYGRIAQLDEGPFVGKAVFVTNTYEVGTWRTLESRIDRENVATPDADLHYTYDDAGNVLSESDAPSGQPADTQCFRYDYLQRLTEAWTATDACASAASVSVLGGPAPYWQSYSYDVSGNRTSMVDHATTASGADTVSTYRYPPADAARPHGVLDVATGPVGGPTTVDAFGYDAAGDTTSLAHDGSAQTLSWDAEGRVASDTTASGTTSYLYDADGGLLLRRDPGSTTLFAGNTELVLDTATGTVKSTRYYDFAGQPVATRASGGVLWLTLSDRGGTALTAVDDENVTVKEQRILPFGAPRGVSDRLPGARGLARGSVDAATALTNLGAREYDPALGRFLSVDPVLDTADPQAMNGYGYAGSSPVTFADPSGLCAQLGGNDGYYCGSTYHPAPAGRYVPPSRIHGLQDTGHSHLPPTPAQPQRPEQHHWWQTAWHATADFTAGAGQGLVNGATSTLTLGMAGTHLDSCPYGDTSAACTAGQVGGQVGVAVAAAFVPGAGEARLAEGAIDPERELDVVGSAAPGERRGLGTDLPIGKSGNVQRH